MAERATPNYSPPTATYCTSMLHNHLPNPNNSHLQLMLRGFKHGSISIAIQDTVLSKDLTEHRSALLALCGKIS